MPPYYDVIRISHVITKLIAKQIFVDTNIVLNKHICLAYSMSR